VVADIDSHQAHAIRFANRSRVVVLNVDYRLAPEHPFPQGVNDAFAAGGRLKTSASSAVSTSRWPSAGTAQAATSLPLRLFAVATPCRSQRPCEPGARGGGNPDVAYMYFGPDLGAAARDTIEASPILADLKGVAPAIIGVGSHDFLHDDSIAYAARLRDVGVRLIYREYPTLNRGFFSYTAISPACAAAADQLCDDLKSLLS
jgi:acetyl esterase